MNLKKLGLFHPDLKVDLAIMPLLPILDQIKHLRQFFISLDKNLVLSDEKLKELSPFENVLIVGYQLVFGM